MYFGLSTRDVLSDFSFLNDLFRVPEVLGNTFLEALCKERNTAAMNLNSGKKATKI